MSKEAMKLALELAQEGVEIHSPNSPEYKVCSALIEALAKQEQCEPVAWVIWFCGGPVGFFEKEADAIEEFERRNLNYPDESRKLLPLYTTPQQRTWVGLTDEDKASCVQATAKRGSTYELIAAIEAKLKEKNT
jgi:hypothetical protein